MRRSVYTSVNYVNDQRSRQPDGEVKFSQPVAPPASIISVFVTLILQFCRRILFFNTSLRIGIYITSLFVLSVIADALPIPKTYLSDTKNIFNSYFVKLGWFWTLVVSVPFVVLTSITYCCGKRDMVIKHTIRLLIATANWYIFVNLFIYIESNYGTCVDKREIKCKSQCGVNGGKWSGIDISGHSFILIYSTLVLIEEAKCVIGWESLNDIIRNESFWRGNPQRPFGPLRDLNNADFIQLHNYYTKTLPYVRGLLVVLTTFTLIWDGMLLSTILYFHSMPEKLFGGLTAILVWFMTYHIWYKIPNMPPYLPGEGLFKYNIPSESRKNNLVARRNSIPSFMGTRVNVQSNEIS